MAGGSMSSSHFNARKKIDISTPKAHSLVRTAHGADVRVPQQQPEENPFRKLVRQYEKPRTVCVTFSLEDSPLQQSDIKEYLHRFVGVDVGLKFHLDWLNHQGWIVLSGPEHIRRLLGYHRIRHATMEVKPFMD